MNVPIPPRIAELPVNDRGFPVPFFVEWIDDKPDFRVTSPTKMKACYEEDLCWICGDKLGQYLAFTVGPMCAVNRINSEPPSHLDCARYAAQACPFLSTPRMHRREHDLPEGMVAPAGIALSRNPGATCVWVTKSYKPFNVGNGVLFDLGPPTSIEWYAEGRKATREEVMESVRTGLPTLQKFAEEEGPVAVKALDEYYQRFLRLLPSY